MTLDPDHHAEIARRAEALTGTPEDLADRLKWLIEHPPREGFNRQGERRAIRLRLAMDFGARRGWTLSTARFSGEDLAGRSINTFFDGPRILTTWPHESFAHCDFYRRNDQPTAIVMHPYHLTDAGHARLVAESASHGLLVEFPEDYPSWWHPGWTTLTVFARQDSGQ